MPLHYRAFQATFQLTPLKCRPVRDVWISFFFFAYEHPAASQSDQRTRKSLVLQPGCISEGPQPPIDQSAQTCPGPSPPMHHGAACWSQKSLTTTNISAATACLPLISCREIFLEYPSPFEEGEERKPHPSPPQSPGNYSQTHCSFLFFCSPPPPPCCTSSAGCLSVVPLSLHSAGLTVSAQTLLTLQPLHILGIQYSQFWHSQMFHYWFNWKLKGHRHYSRRRKDKAAQHDTVAPIISPTEKLVIKTPIFQLIDSSKWQPFFSWLDRIH